MTDKNFTMPLPFFIEEILYTLELNNFESYIVGGSLRDYILGREINDYDITTSATPLEIKSIFKDDFLVIDTGISHGTLTIVSKKDIHLKINTCEVTTFRIDGDYVDGRRPEEVFFTRNLEDDLSRRDFTINALAYNPKVGLVDNFNGIYDLKNKKINTIGESHKRFCEDYLRMMRAYRFSSKLSFTISDDIKFSIKNLGHNLKSISIERITLEFNKLLIGDNIEILKDLRNSSMLETFFPEYLNLSENSENTLIQCLKNCKKDVTFRITIILYFIFCKCSLNSMNSSFEGEKILRRLKYPKKVIIKVKIFLENIPYKIENKTHIKLLLYKIGIDNFKDILYLKYIVEKCHNLTYLELNSLLVAIIDNKECYTIKDLSITGEDLIELGYKGKDIGIILKKLLLEVINTPELNNLPTLKKLALFKLPPSF